MRSLLPAQSGPLSPWIFFRRNPNFAVYQDHVRGRMRHGEPARIHGDHSASGDGYSIPVLSWVMWKNNSDTIDLYRTRLYVCLESRELTEVAVNVIKEINSCLYLLKSWITQEASALGGKHSGKAKRTGECFQPPAARPSGSGSASSSGTPAKQSLISGQVFPSWIAHGDRR